MLAKCLQDACKIICLLTNSVSCLFIDIVAIFIVFSHNSTGDHQNLEVIEIRAFKCRKKLFQKYTGLVLKPFH